MDFKLDSTKGELSLKDFEGKPLVLYFYPKDNTSGCTVEAEGFRDLYDEFKKLGAEVVGISKDTVKSHIKFKEKLNLPFELLADPEREVHREFDVLKAGKMYGKDVIRTIRSTFIFDKEGKLVKEFRDVKAKTHPEEVLEYLKNGI
ncbi:peroxiredoxin [Peptoniphilus duerdenii]|uniref:peroxiredoxin n=1 Tax=Peptoniphilus duerdenii TaxID=507750 RepID=UPI00254BA027|nr:peroxiredoxin [Peptoniphilus duerdenii]MDK8277115.1 peroxiredoxin [Peptoniphilus duerdenii]